MKFLAMQTGTCAHRLRVLAMLAKKIRTIVISHDLTPM